jgi:hypothetical protein
MPRYFTVEQFNERIALFEAFLKENHLSFFTLPRESNKALPYVIHNTRDIAKVLFSPQGNIFVVAKNGTLKTLLTTWILQRRPRYSDSSTQAHYEKLLEQFGHELEAIPTFDATQFADWIGGNRRISSTSNRFDPSTTREDEDSKCLKIAITTKLDEEDNDLAVHLAITSTFPCSLLIETPCRNFDLATFLPHIQLRLTGTVNEEDIAIFVGRAVSTSSEIDKYDVVLHLTVRRDRLDVGLPAERSKITFDIMYNGTSLITE